MTERYVQKALVELLNVTLDTREWENAPRRTRGERPLTGGWECIYKGPLLETPVASFGADMSLKGKAIKLPKAVRSVAPVYNYNGREVLTQTLDERERASTRMTVAPLAPRAKPQVEPVRPTPMSTIVRETPHPCATYTMTPTSQVSKRSTPESAVTEQGAKPFPTTILQNKLIKPIVQPPPSIDDSITFDDSDGDGEIADSGPDSEIPKNELDIKSAENYTTLPKALIASISSNVNAIKASTKGVKVSVKPANSVVVQPKLFQIDF